MDGNVALIDCNFKSNWKNPIYLKNQTNQIIFNLIKMQDFCE